MANEVIITYHDIAPNNDGLASGVYGKLLGGEVLDIGTRSGKTSGDVVRIQAKGSAFWVNIGGSGVNATANTDGNIYLKDGDIYDYAADNESNYIDTAADA